MIAMYGDGLRRIIETIEASREAGATILDQLAQDGAVASLLLIHDLYPVSLEERVTEALDTVRPYMESHGGNVELLAIEDGVARLALQGSCNGCAASRATLELAIKQALDEHAPDLAGLEVEGVTRAAPPRQRRRVRAADGPLGTVGTGPAVDEAPPRWVPLDGAAELEPGELRRSPSTARRCCSPASTARCSPTGTRAPPAASRCTTASSTGRCCAARLAGSSSTSGARAGPPAASRSS